MLAPDHERRGEFEQHGRGLYSFLDLSIQVFSLLREYTEEMVYPKPRSSAFQMEDFFPKLGPILTFLRRVLFYTESEEERLVRYNILVNSWVKRGGDKGC